MMKVHARNLSETLSNKSDFLSFNWTIGVEFHTKNPFQPTMFVFGGRGTKSHVSLARGASISSCIADNHSGCLTVNLNPRGSKVDDTTESKDVKAKSTG